MCEAGEYKFRVAEALPGARPEMIPGFTSQRVETDGLERFSRPTNFAQRYHREIEAAQRLVTVAQERAEALAKAEADRKGRGRWARLRAAWRGV